MKADEALCQLEVSLGGYRIALKELMKLQGEGRIVLGLPDQLQVELKFMSIPFGVGVGVIEGDNLVITLKRSMNTPIDEPLEFDKDSDEADRKNLFSELESIYRKLSFRRND